MKRVLISILVLLMAVALLGVAGWRTRAVAEEGPAPDAGILEDPAQEEQVYYGYRMEKQGQAVDLPETLVARGEDVRDYFLVLRSDGTGHLQFGSEESGGEIIWTDAELIADGEGRPYTRTGDHIRITLQDAFVLEFAPREEVDALLSLLEAEHEEKLTGEWRIAMGVLRGRTLSAEQIRGLGLEMSYRFNADGTVVLTSNDTVIDGITWAKEGPDIVLTRVGSELYRLTWAEQYLVLSTGGDLYFEKAD